MRFKGGGKRGGGGRGELGGAKAPPPPPQSYFCSAATDQITCTQFSRVNSMLKSGDQSTSSCAFSRSVCPIGWSTQVTANSKMIYECYHMDIRVKLCCNVWFLLYNYLTLPVVELEVSGGESLADTLGVTVGVPGCRWLNLGEVRLRFGVLCTGASAIGD